ncbi:hypothetical protein [Cellulomonas cellasea]|uniref:DUF4439 domain-containing protein n=1 Tax=Cellulomonas cellasea TaxID=43670 RepID=A0A7W4YBC5_9CELL|nr:hypothetical protein [Cellulomonas cellasea]MBB2923543.1 hypothetical protein [Cellulomonas cellasea]
MNRATAAPGSTRRRAVAAAALAALLVAGAAGCTPGPGDTGSPGRGTGGRATGAPPTPAPDRPPGADPSGNLRLLAEHGPPPLDAWGWTAPEADTVARAVEELTARCMAERGFAYERSGGAGAAGGADGALGEPVTHWGGFLGLVSHERARTTGYQVLDVEARLAERARLEQEATRTPDPAYVAALTGEGAPGGGSGCSGWAFDQVTPADPAVDRRIQERLYGAALRRAEEHPAVVRALDGWVACMARHGYAIETVPVPADTDPVTAELVDQAVADVGCKDETGLVDTYVTALYDAERALAAEHRAELEAFAAWGRERVRLATEALAG